MSNVETRNRVRHISGIKGELILTRRGLNGVDYVLVQLENSPRNPTVWRSEHVKPIVTVRG